METSNVELFKIKNDIVCQICGNKNCKRINLKNLDYAIYRNLFLKFPNKKIIYLCYNCYFSSMNNKNNKTKKLLPNIYEFIANFYQIKKQEAYFMGNKKLAETLEKKRSIFICANQNFKHSIIEADRIIKEDIYLKDTIKKYNTMLKINFKI